MRLLCLTLIVLFSFSLQSVKADANKTEERIQAYYTPKVRAELKAYRRSFNQVYSLGDWVHAYRKAVNLRDDFSTPLNQEHEKYLTHPKKYPQPPDFNWAIAYFPGFEIVYVAEGTILELVINYVDFAHLARKTPEKEDDHFIALMRKAHGDVFSYYPRWFEQTWDYGGCSQLGGGLHLELLQEMEKNLQLSAIFAPEIKELRDQLLKDILESPFFCHPRAKVLKEFEAILNQAQLNIGERQKLEKRLKELRTSPKLEFNCLHGGSCSFG